MQKTPKMIQSVQRAIDIISCFHGSPVELSLGEISDMLSLNKSTVHGIISTLYANDYVAQAPNGKYKLGPVFLTPSADENETKRLILAERATPVMQELADRYSGSVALSYRYGADLVAYKRITPETARYRITVRDSVLTPDHALASGKLLLSFMEEDELLEYLDQNPLTRLTPNTLCTLNALKEDLDRIRERGYSIEDEELGLGIYSVSFPIRDEKKELFATLSITGPTGVIKGDEALVRDLGGAAAHLNKLVFN